MTRTSITATLIRANEDASTNANRENNGVNITRTMTRYEQPGREVLTTIKGSSACFMKQEKSKKK